MAGKLVFRQNLSTSSIIEHFSDQWEDHTRRQMSRTFTDLVLVPDSGEKVEVHMAVLRPLFPFLTDLVTESMAWVREHPVIILPEIKFETVQQMVSVLYSGTCDIVCPDQREEVVGLMASLGLIVPNERLNMDYKELPTVGQRRFNNNVSVAGRSDGNLSLNENENKHKRFISSTTTVVINDEVEAVKKEDTSDEVHGCLLCNRVFKYKRSLALHLKSHTDERPYSCSSCEKTFKQSQHLTIHTKAAKHEGFTDIPPPAAGRKSLAKSYVDKEVYNVTFGGKYKCKLCVSTFRSTSRLNFHMKIKHKKVITLRKKDKLKKIRGPRKVALPATATEISVVSVQEGDNRVDASETVEDIEKYLQSKGGLDNGSSVKVLEEDVNGVKM